MLWEYVQDSREMLFVVDMLVIAERQRLVEDRILVNGLVKHEARFET